jgi:hypothetical protein
MSFISGGSDVLPTIPPLASWFGESRKFQNHYLVPHCRQHDGSDGRCNLAAKAFKCMKIGGARLWNFDISLDSLSFFLATGVEI